MSALEERVKGVLVSEEEAKEIVERLGKQISKDYEGKNLVLVSVLKGAVVFMADLMRAIDIPLSIDFMVVSSYNKTESTGTVKIIKDLDTDLTGKDILIVEDILDTPEDLHVPRQTGPPRLHHRGGLHRKGHPRRIRRRLRSRLR